jgi:hypothetical protein
MAIVIITLHNLCLQLVMAEMPANRDLQSKEEYGISHHIKKA